MKVRAIYEITRQFIIDNFLCKEYEKAPLFAVAQVTPTKTGSPPYSQRS